MQVTKITTKGQVTIPIEIRKQFSLKPGGQVMFSIDDDKIVLHPVPVSIEDSFGLISSSHSVTLDDMDVIIRNQAAGK
jgi:AbrB family looped-hinge helix DNA binding protein